MEQPEPDHALDPESLSWVEQLTSTGPQREAAMVRLRELLLAVTTAEARRRGRRFRLFGPELDDLAQQAATDATLAVCGRIASFRGESRFTTWAYKFAIFDVSAKLGRHFWRDAGELDDPDWDALPDRVGGGPGAVAEGRELLDALRVGVEQVLTDRQRRIFVALALNGMPLDAVVAHYDSNRNAIYKAMFDARRKLRGHLVACGLLDDDRLTSGGRRRADDTTLSSIPELVRFLGTDPRDVGCGSAMQVLHLYADMIAADDPAAGRYPGVAAHLAACGPCGEDFETLLSLIVGRP